MKKLLLVSLLGLASLSSLAAMPTPTFVEAGLGYSLDAADSARVPHAVSVNGEGLAGTVVLGYHSNWAKLSTEAAYMRTAATEWTPFGNQHLDMARLSLSHSYVLSPKWTASANVGGVLSATYNNFGQNEVRLSPGVGATASYALNKDTAVVARWDYVHSPAGGSDHVQMANVGLRWAL